MAENCLSLTSEGIIDKFEFLGVQSSLQFELRLIFQPKTRIYAYLSNKMHTLTTNEISETCYLEIKCLVS